MKLAIDIGSNTSKCLLGESQNGAVLRIWEKSLDCRILDRSGLLVDSAADMICGALSYFLAESKKLQTDFSVEAVATSALRDYPRSGEIVARVLAETGVKIKIISGDEEARLSYLGAMSDPLLDSSKHCSYFDLGGGSVEIAVGRNGVVAYSKSLPLGAVRLTRELGGVDEYFEACDAVFSESLADCPPSDILVGAGGAVVAARLMKRELGLGGAENILSVGDIRQFLSEIYPMSTQERIVRYGISPNRADIIPAAFACIISVMRFLKKSELTHTFCNIRYGMILSERV